MKNKLEIELSSMDGKGIWMRREEEINGASEYYEPDFLGQDVEEALDVLMDKRIEYFQRCLSSNQDQAYIFMKNSPIEPVNDSTYSEIKDTFYDLLKGCEI